MTSKLEKLRERLKQDKESSQSQGGDGALYPFWNIPADDTAIVRFLPDANEENPFFWTERRIIKLPFQGIKGQSDKRITVDVPCKQMWGEKCPITEEIKDYWNDDELKELAKTYYRKVSFVYQGFVVNDPINEENPPENPIRRFVINKTLHEKIKSSLMDDEIDELPVDYKDGIDFKIIKTQKGQYNNYDTSTWSRKTRALSDDELAAIETYGLKDLSDFLPKKPSSEELDVIMEMFESSMEGEAYDPERFAKFYKPYGLQRNNDSEETTEAQEKPKAKPKATTSKKANEEVSSTETSESEVTESSETTSSSTQDLLAQIKKKRQQG